MEIYINGHIVDFTIEHEEYFYELIPILEKTIASYNDFITELKIDDQIIDLSQTLQNQTPLSHIKIIHITTQSILSQAEYMLSQIGSMITEIERIANDKEALLQNKAQILEVLDGIYKTLDNTSNILYVPFIYVFKNGDFLKDDADGLMLDHKILTEKNRDNHYFIEHFLKICLPRLKKIKDFFIPQMVTIYNILFAKNPDYLQHQFFRDILDLQDEMASIFDILEDLTTLFQMGKDKEGIKGLEKLLLIYEFISQLLLRSILLGYISSEDIQPAQEKIQENIKAMDNALVEKDMITLCDTIEYEYIPNLQGLIRLLPNRLSD